MASEHQWLQALICALYLGQDSEGIDLGDCGSGILEDGRVGGEQPVMKVVEDVPTSLDLH